MRKYHPINMLSYKQFIILSGLPITRFCNKLREYEEIYFKNESSHKFEYVSFIDKDETRTLLIRCPQNISFYHYHNLVIWYEEYTTYGVMLHQNNMSDSYFCYPDYDNKYRDTLIGTFDNNIQFSIYVPDANLENGSIEISKEIRESLSLKELIDRYGMDYFFDFDSNDYQYIIINI